MAVESTLRRLRFTTLLVIIGTFGAWYLVFTSSGSITIQYAIGSVVLVIGGLLTITGMYGLDERRIIAGVAIEFLSSGAGAMGALELGEPIGLVGIIGLGVLIIAQYQFGSAAILCRRYITEVAWRDTRVEHDIENAFEKQANMIWILVGISFGIAYLALLVVGLAVHVVADDTLALTASLVAVLLGLMVIFVVIRGGKIPRPGGPEQQPSEPGRDGTAVPSSPRDIAGAREARAQSDRTSPF